MSIRIFAIAIALFALIALTEQNKPMIKKWGRIMLALVFLFANMILDAGKASVVASYLQMDELFMFAKEVMYSFGLSGSALISVQMFALSAVTMFALLYMDCKASFCLNKTEKVVSDDVKQKAFSANCRVFGFLSRPCATTKRLN